MQGDREAQDGQEQEDARELPRALCGSAAHLHEDVVDVHVGPPLEAVKHPLREAYEERRHAAPHQRGGRRAEDTHGPEVELSKYLCRKETALFRCDVNQFEGVRDVDDGPFHADLFGELDARGRGGAPPDVPGRLRGTSLGRGGAH